MCYLVEAITPGFLMLQLILSYRQKDLMSGFFNNPMHPFHIVVLGVLLVLGSSFLS